MTKTTTKSRLRKSDAVKADCNSRTTSKSSKLTKKARLISLLTTKAGADITSISKRFGWLPHTTRAALSRLRKAGYAISCEQSAKGKPAKYRITVSPMGQNAQ